jgi:serine/threonine protein kinase
MLMGTPYYMPPEQAIGDMEGVDHLSDIYSLGAIFYEMISGVCPYTTKSPDEVLTLLPKEPPEPILTHAPQLSLALLSIIEKAMQREKKDRYSSARLMSDDLQRWLDGQPLAEEPIGARPKTMWNKIRDLFGAK